MMFSNPEVVECPVCGQNILGENDFEFCDHVAFAYVPMMGGYVYASFDFDKRTDGIDLEDIDIDFEDMIKDILKKAGYGKEMVVIVEMGDFFGFDTSIKNSDNGES